MPPPASPRIAAILAALVLALISSPRVTSGAVVEPGDVLFSSSELHCLARVNASLDFECLPTPGISTQTQPTSIDFSLDGQTIYFTASLKLWRMSPETGAIEVVAALPGFSFGQVIVTPSKLYCQGTSVGPGVVDSLRGDIYEVDPNTGDTTHVVEGVLDPMAGTAFLGGQFYQAMTDGHVDRIDPADGIRHPVPSNPGISAVSDIVGTAQGELWLIENHGAASPGRLIQIDPVSGVALDVILHPDLRGAEDVSADDDGTLYVSASVGEAGSGAVSRHKPGGASSLVNAGHRPFCAAARPGESTAARVVSWGRLKTIYR